MKSAASRNGSSLSQMRPDMLPAACFCHGLLPVSLAIAGALFVAALIMAGSAGDALLKQW